MSDKSPRPRYPNLSSIARRYQRIDTNLRFFLQISNFNENRWKRYQTNIQSQDVQSYRRRGKIITRNSRKEITKMMAFRVMEVRREQIFRAEMDAISHGLTISIGCRLGNAGPGVAHGISSFFGQTMAREWLLETYSGIEARPEA